MSTGIPGTVRYPNYKGEMSRGKGLRNKRKKFKVAQQLEVQKRLQRKQKKKECFDINYGDY
jgi:hypothetical protein